VTNLLTRAACPDDAEAIVGILNPIIEAGTYSALDTPFSVDAEREYLTSFPARGVFQVALRAPDRQIAGFQSMEPVYQRHGFSVVGTARRHARIGGRYIDEIVIEKIFENE
jgi:L-amino acid N-acyltransferase YncA